MSTLDELEQDGFGTSVIGDRLRRDARKVNGNHSPRCIHGQREGMTCGEPSVLVLDGMPYCTEHYPSPHKNAA